MTDLPTFLLLLAVAYLVPGPDFAIIVNSATRDLRLGRAAALGVVTGLAVHALLAAAGVSSLIAATSWGLDVLRVVGSGFLLWAGISTLIAAVRGGDDGHAPVVAATTPQAAWRRGLFGNLLNPKTLLFFLALIPQFVDADHAVLPQVATLSAITVLAGVLWWSLVVYAAGRLIGLLRRPRVRRRVDLATGVALLGLAGLVVAG